ncbi:MAG: MerR family transcriptional regulator [Candidatus Latescibacteria bacterium]|nr:MerR family transcriptional regulator [Candidatus Latescibacterota bacterium]
MKRKDDRFGTNDAKREIGVSFERLRYWEYRGIVSPLHVECGTRKFRRYSKEDIQRAKFVKMLVDEERYSLDGAINILETKSSLIDVL